METLMDFIKKVEEEVFETIQYYANNHKDFRPFTDVWVHQFTGEVILDDIPDAEGYVCKSALSLCDWVSGDSYKADKRAIKKWVEGTVLLHQKPKQKKKRPIRVYGRALSL